MRGFLLGVLVGAALGVTVGMAFLSPPEPERVHAPIRPVPAPAPAPRKPALPHVSLDDAPAADTTAPSGRSERAVSTEDLLETLERNAREGSPPGDAHDRLQRILITLRNRKAPVPAALVDLLLDHSEVYYRGAGAFLAPLVSPPPMDRLAVDAAGWFAHCDVTARNALILAARDREPGVRLFAVDRLARLAEHAEDEHARAAVVAALADDDLEVRDQAMQYIEELGDAGARHALALLESGDYRPDLAENLARAIVCADLTARALELDPEPWFVLQIVEALGYEAEERPELLRAVKGRFPSLLERTLGSGESAQEPLFHLASLAGEREFLVACFRDDELPHEYRIGALNSILNPRETTAAGIELAYSFLQAGKDTAVFRGRVVEALGGLTDRESVAGVFRHVAESDPSPRVRAIAKEFLE